ncbi:MAG: glycerol kinase 5 [Promethearchaeota archaeon]
MSYILAVDVGTTGIRAIVFDREGNVKARAYQKIKVIVPQEGFIEHDPLDIWDKCLEVVKASLQEAGLNAGDIAAIGIATQRATVTLWDKETGEPLYNFISWQDIRTVNMADKINSSFKFKMIRSVAKFAYKMGKSKKMLLGSLIQITPAHASIRTKWLLDNVEGVDKLVKAGRLVWGTIDTWLVWKLTGGKVHATDVSNISATGIFDVFAHDWSSIILGVLKLPTSILPEIKASSADYGETEAGLFGSPIPIRAVIADQQSSLFAQGCFKPGDVKCTNGTGTFIGMNTGTEPFVSKQGLFPFIAWQIGDEVVYMLEGLSATTGELIEWGRDISLYKDPSETEELALSVEDSHGVYFVPAFAGIQFPWWDPTARGTIIGLSRDVNRGHLVRAFLEGLAFRGKDILESMRADTGLEIRAIKADGGVSKNNFLLQFMADILNTKVVRSQNPDMTALGAGFLAGLDVGYWKDKDELLGLQKVDREFTPQMSEAEREKRYAMWKKAVSRALGWSEE